MTQKTLDYTGFSDLAIFDDGSWVAPAGNARDGKRFAVAVWTTNGYEVRKGFERVAKFCDADRCFLDPEIDDE